MKTHKSLYAKLCSYDNLISAYKKARRGKSKKLAVIEFDKNTKENLEALQKELIEMTYTPLPLKRFIVRDPKTRTIHASAFRDRIVHHMLVNVLEPILEKIFIFDSYASRKGKGIHSAIKRFDQFKRKVSRSGRLIRTSELFDRSNEVEGYVLKADIAHYFDTVDHEVLINLIKKKVNDGKIIWLNRKILHNFNAATAGKGMPLGNFTSQFFANVYLNALDYFVKHELKAKYYIRYVDDFVILHRGRKRLEYFQRKITEFLKDIKLNLHKDKSSIIPLQKGITFLGYRIFYHHKLLRKRNRTYFLKKFEKYLQSYSEDTINEVQFIAQLRGWFGYAQWADTYLFRKRILMMALYLFEAKNYKKEDEIYLKIL